MANISELIVPRTQLRLAPYIKIFTNRGGYDPLVGGPPPATDIIGQIQELTIDNKRDAFFYRSLDADNFGLEQETYPGLPTYELTLKRIVLYRANMLEEFGFFGEDIINQQIPLQIYLELRSPGALAITNPGTFNVGSPTQSTNIPSDTPSGPGTSSLGNGSGGGSRAWVISGVWFKNNPLTFDITGTDLKIEQTIEAIAQNITTVR